MAVEADQIALMQEMNRLLTLQAESLNTITQRLGNQSAAYQEVTSAADDLVDKQKDQINSTNILDAAIKGLNDGWDNFVKSMTDWIPDSVKNGFDLLKNNFDSLASAVAGPMASIQGFFSKIYEFFIEKAVALAKESKRYAEALEDVRDKFGDLNENTSRQVVASARTLSSGLANAAGSSRAFAGKFGVGIDASIAQLQKMSEIAGDLGPTFDTLGEEGFKSASTQLYVLKDGLNFTSEGLQATTRLAQISGESLTSFSQHIMSSVDKIGKHFGMSTKVLGGDVGKALGNFKMLGKMTGDYVKEITKAAVFTRKLGIEITTLTGLVDKFDDFESGAEAAAQLAQGFGLVVDPLKMMGMEVGPRLAELQKGFIATGRSIDSMTRQERALLAQTSGLSDEQVQLAFSQKGLSMSYDDISKGANEAAEKQKANQQVMFDLAKNIKNIIQPLVEMSGFIEAFVNGFLKGFGMSGGFLGIITPLAKMLVDTAKIGEATGRILANFLFPVKDKKDPRSLFSILNSVGQMFVEIADQIKDFAKVFTSGGDISTLISQFFLNISHTIEDHLGFSITGFDPLALIDKFGTLLLQVINGGVKFFVKKIPEWTANLRKAFTSPAGPAAGFSQGLKDSFSELKDNLGDLMPVLEDFGKELLGAIGRFLKEYPWVSAITGIFAAGGPMATIFVDIGVKIVEMIKGLFGSGIIAASESSTAGAVSSTEAAAAVAATTAADVTSGVTSTMQGAVGEAVTGGAGVFQSIFSIIEDPLKLAAWGAGIGVFMMALGTAIRDVMLSFTEPIPGKEGKSFIDVIAESANKLSAINVGDLLALGGIFTAVFAGIGGLVFAMSKVMGMMPTSGMLMLAGLATTPAGAVLALAAALGIGAVASGAAGWLAGKVVGGIAEAIRSMLAGVIDAFTDANFITTIKKAGLLGSGLLSSVEGVTAFASVMESIAKIVTSTKNALDAIYTVSPDLDAAETSSREIAKQKFAEKIASVGMTISAIAPVIGASFDSIAAAFPAVADGASTAGTIKTGTESLVALAGAVENIKKIVDAVAGINSVVGPALEASNGMFKGGREANDPTNLINGIADAVDIFRGRPGASGRGKDGVIGALKLVPDVDVGMLNGKIAGLTAMKGALEAFNKAIGSFSDATTPEGASAFSTNINALMIENGPIDKLRTLFNSSISPGAAFADLPTPDSTTLTKKIDSIFNILDHYIERATTTSESMADARMREFSTRVLKITDYVATTRRILENLNAIPLDATIDNLGANMKVAKSVFSIAGGAVKIAVNMNVTMNAEKMAAGLVMSGYVKPTQDFENFLLTKDGNGDTYSTENKDWVYGGQGDKKPKENGT